MKKTYKNQLPKNMEVQNTNVRIENGELVVEVEFKERFEPKDGDFLVSLPTHVFIHNGLKGERTIGAYIGTMSDGEIRVAETKDSWAATKICRYATPEEKAAFLEQLEKEYGKRWNKETKKLEDIRWRAKAGEGYYTINGALDVVGEFAGACPHEDILHERGNYFRSNEAAQKVADQIKDIFKNSKAE